MANTIKKKNRRLKKSIRKTLGALFLASAIVVAAIPVEGLQAENTDKKITLSLNSDTEGKYKSNIPDVTKDDEIYTTGDGRFQFAYVYPAGYTSGPKIAVILGYQKGGKLEGGILQIPNTVDAYKKFSNVSTNSGYAAVNKAGDFLYFQDYELVVDEFGAPVYEQVEKRDENGAIVRDPETLEPIMENKVDDYGNPIQEKRVIYSVCFYEDRAKWENLADDKFFYYEDPDNTTGIPTPTSSDNVQRIKEAAVWYIGNQYLTADADGGWTIADNITTGEQGIFSQASNISTLIVGEDLTGIGNYAFYGCTGMSSITLNNGLDTIGNYAFANCVNMTEVNVDISANVTILGDHAFYNCQALENFVMPRAVTYVGDSAFEECYALKSIELCGAGSNVQLKELGYDVFKGCANLKNITFPRTFDNNISGGGEKLDVAIFQGCISLQYIATSANKFDLKAEDDINFTFEDFKKTVPATFYLKGNYDEDLHDTATENEIAFSYYDSNLERDVYELTVVEDDRGNMDPSDDKKVVYRVDDNDELVYCQMDSGLTTVTLPTTIGPNSISKIDEFTFQNKCFLEKITIPASITSIAQNAFKGCHNLLNVIFVDPTALTSIGTGAFKTQECTFHQDGCDKSLDKAPQLNFVGPISYSSTPFNYAMNPSEKINVGTQDESYITYYSGWPTNLVVKYDSETDKNTLVDYPTFEEIKGGNHYTTSNFAYMTKEYEDAAKKAIQKYLGTYQPTSDPNDTATMTDYEKEIIRAALEIVLPEGIEAIGTVEDGGTVYGLFEYKEKNEILGTDGSANTIYKTITAQSLTDVADSAFKGCKNVSSIVLKGDTQSIGNYAFEDCAVLKNVSIPASVSSLGLRPFTGCKVLSDVNFNGGSYFDCENSIIYELDDSGNKEKIVEYLEGRTSTSVKADELSGIKEIYPEAFQGTGVSLVDLTGTQINNVPVNAFKDTTKLYSVSLPETCKSIDADAFSESSIQQLYVPESVTVIHNDAFRDTDGDGMTSKNTLEFECVEGSTAYLYAQQNGIKTSVYIPVEYFTVTFWDYDGTLLKTQEKVVAGTDAEPPEVPGRDGYILSGWVPDYHGVTSNLAVTAQYEAIDPDTLKVTVTFLDWDDSVIKEVRVMPGESAEPPKDPVRDGYDFIGWRNSYTNVTENVTVYALYEKVDSSASEVTVRFIDWDESIYTTQRVTIGGNAIIPQNPSRIGYVFLGWRPLPEAVTKDLDVYAQYDIDKDQDGIPDSEDDYIGEEVIVTPDNRVTVTFYDWDDRVHSTQKVDVGFDAVIPQNPVRDGYVFMGWKPVPKAVTKDTDCYAVYEVDKDKDGIPDSEDDDIGDSSSSGSNNGGDTNTGGNTTDGTVSSKLYTLTVVNGSGSGSYLAGTQPIIICDDPSSTQEFSHWTIEPSDTVIASKVMTATVITMPETNVTVTAHYKTKDSSNSNTVDTNRPSGGTTTTNGSTTVVIDKNGLSNTGVVSVVVNGSSDNFTIKIAESSAATESVIRALQAQYGDISNLKYFPMDITLYDSTGTKKITDTTGLSIRITLPLPDSLIAYAGNNKVAGVVNDRLDSLSAKFTTINGVACISFTAEHFSPYVIYVDTKNASTSTGVVVPDETPKTGDGIHPKWFLSIGLACLSFVMFMYKDKKKVPAQATVKRK